VGSGYVSSLAHPGGNVTGFHNFEPAVGGKWLGVLKQIAPQVRRVGFVHVPEIAANVSFIRAADAKPELRFCARDAGFWSTLFRAQCSDGA
jgi:putative ABC transport system substrate-binding protein